MYTFRKYSYMCLYIYIYIVCTHIQNISIGVYVCCKHGSNPCKSQMKVEPCHKAHKPDHCCLADSFCSHTAAAVSTQLRKACHSLRYRHEMASRENPPTAAPGSLSRMPVAYGCLRMDPCGSGSAHVVGGKMSTFTVCIYIYMYTYLYV